MLLETMAGPITICPACGVADPDIVQVEMGIGYYEYWGAPGYDSHEVPLTRCCEADPEIFWPVPNDDEISEQDVV